MSVISDMEGKSFRDQLRLNIEVAIVFFPLSLLSLSLSVHYSEFIDFHRPHIVLN